MLITCSLVSKELLCEFGVVEEELALFTLLLFGLTSAAWLGEVDTSGNASEFSP
jgi:hypothetical protein